MTDMTSHPGPKSIDWTSDEIGARVRKRKAAENRLRYIGLGAIGIAFAMLALLISSLVSTGWQAFRQTHVTIQVTYTPEFINPDNLQRSNYRGLLEATMLDLIPGATNGRSVAAILSNGAQFTARDRIIADPALMGQTVTLRVPTSDPYDQLAKGLIDRDTPEANRRLKNDEIAAFDALLSQGVVSKPFNWALLGNADSRFPEQAGLKGALWGSFYALLTCFLLAFPIGIGAAIYLEEFAPKNKMSDFIEVNINNLAAVPSVVFGLLALAVFLGWFGMGRSIPFVGGMTLALMTLPTIIIATRAALKAVPPSIREAALGVGASKQQVVFHHVLPLAMPGILTGTIIGLAQALGETAPLLLIGMNAFVTAAPATPFDPSTALPTQIFIWADSPERGFVSRTSAAILVLLGFLVMMNAVAIYLRNRFERRW
ncbi:phosphate ABC transporter membrane protein 2, PhoT family [Gemmobacter megaterium]|uniref:Phosphate transport system permease protein PstA n=1 Tax=Gemmobacter megaterium TaxID=1086013 RepID=A0A1N7M0S8_9RHOB|nr:phosphate ABC transporter permease PstA [Gemmobacter megaterium]GGE09450.1 phosphate transport system permease protein PstA [Gemmobacter megaterium]SIS79688.1 phosphate ABC transporter membrane protein 2, PhoT family [Gemmobacter megaterium]